LPREIRDRCLAARTRHGDRTCGLPAGKLCSDFGERGARIVDFDQRDAGRHAHTFVLADDDCGRASRNRVGNERRAVDLGAGKTGKNRTRTNGGTRRGDARNLNIGRARRQFDIGWKHIAKPHDPAYRPYVRPPIIRPDA